MAEHASPAGLKEKRTREGSGGGVNGFLPLRLRGTNGNSKEENMAEAEAEEERGKGEGRGLPGKKNE